MMDEGLRKICVVTGTRAEFGLLTPLLHEINNDLDLQLQLVVTGMHLSGEFGYTCNEVEKLFVINKKVEILLSSDSNIGVSKSMGLAQISFAEVYAELKPDILVVLGDRFEIFSAVATAMVMNIPIAHLSGGELTSGAIDDSIRHAITKMSHIHFVATEEYRKRVIQLGENPKYVFNYGEAGLDNILNIKLLTRSEFEDSLGVKLAKKNLLITYHPETLQRNSNVDFENILKALDEVQDTLLIFTKANSDQGGRRINQLIDDYVARKDNAISFISLGQLRYLSALQYVDAVLGNSSSGIVEAPSFKIGTINIGKRQEGRVQADSVLNCEANKDSITRCIQVLYSSDFRKMLKHVENPYYKYEASKKTKEVIKTVDLTDIIRKGFYDLL